MQQVISEYRPTWVNRRKFGFRGIVQADTVYEIGVSDILQFLVVACGSSSTVSTASYKRCIRSFRIRSIEVFVAGSTTSNVQQFNTFYLEAANDVAGVGDPLERHIAVGYGADEPGHLFVQPKENSQLGMWHDNSDAGDEVFEYNANEISTVMFFIDLEYTLATNGLAPASAVFGFTTTASASVAGTLMFAPLNSVSVTGTTGCIYPEGYRDTSAEVVMPA